VLRELAIGELPALGRFHTVAGAEHEQIWDGTQCRQVLDRLMRRTVLAEPDGVMGHHEYDAIAMSAARRMAGLQ